MLYSVLVVLDYSIELSRPHCASLFVQVFDILTLHLPEFYPRDNLHKDTENYLDHLNRLEPMVGYGLCEDSVFL